MNRHLWRLRFVVAGLWFSSPLCSLSHSAIWFVNDGGSVVSAVAGAASGDVIEIRSNQTFAGSLTWTNKFLTIQAGAGFTPGIVGDVMGPAINRVSGTLGTGGEVVGLRLDGVGLSAVSTRFTDLTLRGNTIGSVGIGGTGQYQVTARLLNNTVLSGMSFGGTGDFRANITVEDNTILDRVITSGTGEAIVDLTLNRNRLFGGIAASSTSHFRVQMQASNNLIQPSLNSSEFGVVANGNEFAPLAITGNFVNNTVLGFNTGLSTNEFAALSFSNMLLKNSDDIGSFPISSIRSSLIADGTAAAYGPSNSSGNPLFNNDFSLQSNSVGIDAGDNTAIIAAPIDLRGNARIVDGNQDGVARVDVGAFETPSTTVPEPTGAALVALLVSGLHSRRRRRW